MASHLSTIFLASILSGHLLAILTQAKPLKGINVTRVNDTSKYSYVISIAYKNDRYPKEQLHLCSGVLVTKKFIITAAHCFIGWSVDKIQIIIGSVDLRQGTKYDASMWITYDEWAERRNIRKQDGLNDIAMIKLSKEVKSQVAKPASLSSKKNKNLLYRYVELVGWGKTLDSSTHPSRYLNKVDVRIIPNVICQLMSSEFFSRKLHFDNYLCTHAVPPAFLADGDSGGPVIMEDSVVAINTGACPKYNSRRLPTACCGNYSFNVHIGIEFYQRFISSVLKNY